MAKRDVQIADQELADAGLEGLVLAKDGIIVNVNRRILKLTGNTPSEVLGKAVVGGLLVVPDGARA